jgi:hypothetical protein
MLQDEYYTTSSNVGGSPSEETVDRMRSLIDRYADSFLVTEAGHIFGTVAVRASVGFVTTGRGKRELDSVAFVVHVDHSRRSVFTAGGKASLNAPLLSIMFKNPNVDHIVHYHQQVPGLPTRLYAPPGTVRDSMRPSSHSFNIAEHGCILLFDNEGRQL